MYTSMTGFASAQIEREWGTVSLELASVNHRHQEIFIRLPKELASFEPWFHQNLRKLYRRGKVNVRVELNWAVSAVEVAVNRDILSHYYQEISAVRDALGQERDISLDALVMLPGVLNSQERMKLAHDSDTETLLNELLRQAAAAWDEMRKAEGAHLMTAVEEHLAELETLMGDIAKKWVIAKEAAFIQMTERIKKALEAAGVPEPDDSRFAQEAVILADRWDVSEEIARMDSHIKKFRETGQADEAVGRKLDFLIQEMNREVNTLTSKIADADIRWLTVEAKTALERIREQIQNLE